MNATPPRIQPSAKPCPICRVSMLGNRTDPTRGEFGPAGRHIAIDMTAFQCLEVRFRAVPEFSSLTTS